MKKRVSLTYYFCFDDCNSIDMENLVSLHPFNEKSDTKFLPQCMKMIEANSMFRFQCFLDTA